MVPVKGAGSKFSNFARFKRTLLPFVHREPFYEQVAFLNKLPLEVAVGDPEVVVVGDQDEGDGDVGHEFSGERKKTPHIVHYARQPHTKNPLNEVVDIALPHEDNVSRPAGKKMMSMIDFSRAASTNFSGFLPFMYFFSLHRNTESA